MIESLFQGGKGLVVGVVRSWWGLGSFFHFSGAFASIWTLGAEVVVQGSKIVAILRVVVGWG